jgi:hypothetical protein
MIYLTHRITYSTIYFRLSVLDSHKSYKKETSYRVYDVFLSRWLENEF